MMWRLATVLTFAKANALHALTTGRLRPSASILDVARHTLKPLMTALDHIDDSSFEEVIKHPPLLGPFYFGTRSHHFVTPYAQAVVEKSKTQPVIVDWYETWCGPCKLVEPMLADLHEAGAVSVVKALPGQNKQFTDWLKQHGARFKITGLPMCVAFVDGKPTSTIIGRFTKAKLDAFANEAVRSSNQLRGVVVPTAGQTGRLTSPVMREDDGEAEEDVITW